MNPIRLVIVPARRAWRCARVREEESGTSSGRWPKATWPKATLT